MIPFFIVVSVVKFAVLINKIENHNAYIFMVVRMFTILVIGFRQLYIALNLKMLSDCAIHLKHLILDDHKHLYENIHYYRQTFSKFDHITDLIVDCFKWTLITLLIAIIFDLINLIYWLFLKIAITSNAYLSASKNNLMRHFHFVVITFFNNFSNFRSYCYNNIDTWIFMFII